MIFLNDFSNKIRSLLNISALYMATEKENIDIIKLLFVNEKIDINKINILIYILK